MTPRLKLLRAPIGFHDAYVAATSQMAALEACGADAVLFAPSIAERVDDPMMLAQTVQQSTTANKCARGTGEEHLAFLDKPMNATPHKAKGRASRQISGCGRQSAR